MENFLPPEDGAQVPPVPKVLRNSTKPPENTGEGAQHPDALDVVYHDIPEELANLNQWVCWKWEKLDGRWTKPPWQKSGKKRASVSSPSTWCTFVEATAAYADRRCNGIGFVLIAKDPYCAIDLDDVRDPVTGTLTPEARDIVDLMDSYTEISPSGTGVRILVRGQLPEGYSSKKPYESYDKGHYVTLTGQPIGTPKTIAEREKQLTTFCEKYQPKKVQKKPQGERRNRTPIALGNALDDDSIWKKVRNAPTWPDFDALWNGDISVRGNDHNVADLALCRHLAFWTGKDFGRIDSLFRCSGLMRDPERQKKWDRRSRSDGATYGQMTIEKAIETTPKTYTGSRPEMASSAHSTTNNTPQAISSEIPAPTFRTEKGTMEYESGQLVELLRPGWDCTALSTHAAHATRIIESVGGDLRFSQNLGWLTFDGRQWQRDDRHATRTADRVKSLSQVVRSEGAMLYQLAGQLAQLGRSTDAEAMSRAAAAHTRHAKQVEAKSFVEGALHFTAGNSAIRVEPDTFDQRPWLIGFQNGVWDKGQWREHQREDFLLQLSPIELDFGVDQSEWLMVLDRMTGGDSDLARTLQDVAGYILSGTSHFRLLPWSYGPKGTGKSTYAELLQTVLGKMAKNIDPKKLQDDAARERLGADLWNRRLAVCAEAGGQRLEAELLKTLSGGDSITVRFLYQESFDALPRHVLLMVANDAPKMDAYDDALKDRVIALPFVHHLMESGPMPLTCGKLIQDVRQNPHSPLARGFAAWSVEGLARIFETQTIYKAPCIQEATAKFWADTDPLTPFWKTVEVEQLEKGVTKGEIRGQYETWCEREGARPFNRNQWARACESFGLEDCNVWRGASVPGWRIKK